MMSKKTYVHRDLELSNKIIRLLAKEEPDNQILALTATILRLKLFGVQQRACPTGQAVVDRLIAAFAPSSTDRAALDKDAGK
jgi:hypothetical protein